MRPLILVGGGGHCKSVIDVAEQAGFEIHGILDLPESVGETILNYPIIGSDNRIVDFVNDYDFVVTVGQIKNSDLRKRIHRKILEAGGQLRTIISPKSHVSNYSKIEDGTVVLHNSVINADVRIGLGCIINTLSNVEHDVTIGDFCHISTGAMVNGGCIIGNNCFVGSQSVLAHGVEIVDGCIISAGSFLHKSVATQGVYFGNPAKLIKRL